LNNIKIKFANWILNRPLLELAQQRSMVISKIGDMSDPINRHLFKLYVFQKSFNREHWVDEIYTFLDKVLDCDWSKKHLTFKESEYYDWLFYDYFHNFRNKPPTIINIDQKYRNIFSKYKNEEIIKGYSIKEFYNLCDSFYNIICPKLEKGEIDLNEYYNIISMFDIKN